MKQLHKVIHRRKLNARKELISVYIEQQYNLKHNAELYYKDYNGRIREKATCLPTYFMEGIGVKP